MHQSEGSLETVRPCNDGCCHTLVIRSLDSVHTKGAIDRMD